MYCIPLRHALGSRPRPISECTTREITPRSGAFQRRPPRAEIGALATESHKKAEGDNTATPEHHTTTNPDRLAGATPQHPLLAGRVGGGDQKVKRLTYLLLTSVTPKAACTFPGSGNIFSANCVFTVTASVNYWDLPRTRKGFTTICRVTFQLHYRMSRT